MPVLINDLEVVVESPQSGAVEEPADVAQAAQQTEAKRLSPIDWVSVLAQQAERLERIRSH